MKLADFTRRDRRTETDIGALVERFNRTATDYPRNSTVHAVFSDQAAGRPDAPAVHDGVSGLTYAELDRASNRLAARLIDRQVPAEAPIGVLADNGVSFVTAALGILKAGAAYCPIETDAPYQRLRQIVDDARCAVLVAEPSQTATAERLRMDCPGLSIVTTEDGTGGDEVVPSRGTPRSLAYVMFTSGTSGRPKGVAVEHRSILRLVLNSGYVPLNGSTRVLMTGSLAFDASVFEIWGPLLNGGLVVRPGKAAILDPEEVGRLIRAHGITTMWLTSSLFNYIVDADVSVIEGLQYLLVGGERLSPAHIARVRDRHPGLTLINGYGPTENTTFTTCHTIDRADGEIPIGKPIANTDVLILDAFGDPAPPGAPGEIAAGGDGLARGYLYDPALTADRFRPHPLRAGQRLYHTGDRGRWTTDGVIEYLGRLDAQIKIRGHRIEPAEIEAQLRGCPAIEHAVVVAIPSETTDRTLAAYVTGAGVDIAAVRDRLLARLPSYMVPAHIVVLDRLPLTPNGKLDVAALPAPDRGDRAGLSAMCTSETERALADVWRDVIGAETIGPADNFFDLGGHSLSVTKLVALVQRRLGVALPMSVVFQSQTLADMARAIMDVARYGTTLADDALVLLGGRPEAPAVFALPPGTGDVLSYIPLATRWPGYRLYAFNFIEAESRFSDYADLITAADPAGPYVLLGYSAGGNLAFHVARELERRGRAVSRVVMIDSGRMLASYPFLADAVRQTTAEFLAHPAIQPYCATPVLRDKVARKIEGLYRLFSRITDNHTIHAHIDVLLGEDGRMEHHYDGRLITSVSAWSSATTGTFAIHRGEGAHNEMLFEPAIEANARRLESILDGAVGRRA